MRRPRTRPSLGALLLRALRRRCPFCGIGHPFVTWWRLSERCPHCTYRYEREDGYWVGAMVVNTAVTEGLFGLLFVAILIATLPDVQWFSILLAGAATNVLVPIFFYPLSKTLWVAIDMFFNPPARAPR
jgi:uncharacterized protein (DUF983 family)